MNFKRKLKMRIPILFIVLLGLNQTVFADHASTSFETGAGGAIMTKSLEKVVGAEADDKK